MPKFKFTNELPLADIELFGEMGSVNYKALLDTGSTCSSIRILDAARIGAKLAYVSPVDVAGGEALVEFYEVRAKLLGRSFKIFAMALDFPRFAGIIGTDLLRHFRIVLDYRSQSGEIE